ncbi:uncharacterized protein LOC131256058 [Magnolia sinica]|uniref:uncharacterized protein LOC131256058 n=1 Tax=Magnolia sinica TaxID=86752 RepID=UPI00265976CF|nr:uncharacterized protein LOC131256058 [Magnolia sinica]XP_058113072.1 uncharacterized protein LOC131256058 [Magnolia sinica]XP_058113073.1 uncharacterized protein LOC131256058 [Magnolia sinica]
MLSIENQPPDHLPCSTSRIPGLKGDERSVAADLDKLSLQEEETAAVAAPHLGTSGLAQDTHLPHFSIRDYVFNARSKDVEVNWPFPQQYLQLCLKHGIKDILPPFEPPDSVRAQCSTKGAGPDKLTVSVEGDETLAEGDLLEKEDAHSLDSEADGINCLVLESSDQAQSPSSADGSLDGRSCSNEAGVVGATASTITSHVQTDKISKCANQIHCSVNEISGSLEASVELEVAGHHHTSKKIESLCGPSDRKCRLIVKLGGISESSRAEEIVSNSSVASEPMASKVCPVCKTFSSTSNTTLNAHIDQCLAVESTSKRATTDVSKHRVKLRKKRSMVDICATAPSCTLEDLDRRNGTNWAVECSLLMPNGEVRPETKRQRLGKVDFVEDEDDRAVYVDSNGTKLRILSKFSDVVAPVVGDDSVLRKHAKDSKEGKSHLVGKKKKRLAGKCSKQLKFKPQSKKLCSLKLYKDEICEASDRKHRMENHEEKEKSLSQLLKARDPIKASESGTLRQWACSKRTGHLKKFSNRDGCGGAVGDPAPPATRNPQIESNQPTSGDPPAERSNILKFSRSSENPATSPRSKRVEIPSNTTNIMDNAEKSLKSVEGDFDRSTESGSVAANGSVLKFSRPSESYAASPRSKRVEINAGVARSSPKPFKNQPFSPKAKKTMTSRKSILLGKPSPSMEARKCSEIDKHSAYKKSQEDKRTVEKSRRVEHFLSDADMIHGSSKTLGPSSDLMKSLRRSEIEESGDEVSIGRNNILESWHTRDQAISMSSQPETTTSKRLDLAAECHNIGMFDMVDSQDEGSPHPSPSVDVTPSKSDDWESSAEEVPVSGDTDIASSSEKAVEDTMAGGSSEAQSSDGNALAAHSYMQSPSHEDEYMGHTSQTEAFMEDREIGYVDEIGDELTGLNSQMTAEADSRVEDDSLSDIQYPRCLPDPMPIQGSGRCLPSPGNAGHDGLQDNMSMTSSGPQFTQDQGKSVDRDLSRSPASVTSTISPPPMERSKLKSSVGLPLVQDIAWPLVANVAELERMKSERENPKVAVPPAKEFSKISDDQPCCCSRKESISRVATLSYQEPQLLRRRNFMGPMMLPIKAKQTASNPYFGHEISTSSSTYPTSRMDEMVIPGSESPIGSVSMKLPLDAVMKFPNCSNFESAAQSSQADPHQPSPSPVLRLMGKNLMVMNKEEDEAMQLRRAPQFGALGPHDHSNAKYLTLLGFSTGNVPNQDGISFYRQSTNGSAVYGNPCNPLPNFNVGVPNGYRNHSNSKMVHQTPLHLAEGHQQAMSMGAFAAPALQPGPKGLKTDSQPQQRRLNKKLSSPFAYHVERTAPHHRQRQKPVSTMQTANPMREVIVIDDSPELEADLGKGNGKYAMGTRGKQQQPLVGILPPMALNSNPRPLKVFSSLPLHNTFSREPPVGPPKSSFLMSCPVANASSTKQGPPEGPSILSPNPFMLPSPPTGYLNSPLYYSPSLR